MKIRVAWLGRASAGPFEQQVDTYRKRVGRRWPAEDRPLRPVTGGRNRDPERAVRMEAEVLERQKESGWLLVALDERGRTRTSEEFAKWLTAAADRGVRGMVFAIGSDIGLDAALLQRADDRLALSSMTLPHAVARLVLWEQIYRATQILGGGAYHRVGLQ